MYMLRSGRVCIKRRVNITYIIARHAQLKSKKRQASRTTLPLCVILSLGLAQQIYCSSSFCTVWWAAWNMSLTSTGWLILPVLCDDAHSCCHGGDAYSRSENNSKRFLVVH